MGHATTGLLPLLKSLNRSSSFEASHRVNESCTAPFLKTSVLSFGQFREASVKDVFGAKTLRVVFDAIFEKGRT
eukprot:109029-Amphidinium_carterae.1